MIVRVIYNLSPY